MRNKDMNIGTRLIIGFGIVLLMMVAVGGAGYWGVANVSKKTTVMLQTDAAIAENAAAARAEILELRRGEKDVFLNIDDKKTDGNYFNTWKSWQVKLSERLANLDKVVYLPEERETLSRMKEEATTYEESFLKAKAMMDAGKIKTPQEGNEEMVPHKDPIHQMEAAANDLKDASRKRMNGMGQVVNDFARHVIIIIVMFIAVAVIIGIGVSLYLTRSITKPLAENIRIADKVAGGDLTQRIRVHTSDELGILGETINKMVGNLSEMVETANQTAAQVASAADQVGKSAQQINKGAAVQASAADETSSSMEEMAASIQSVADNAGQLASNVDMTSASVNQMVASIEQVAKNSQAMASSVSETSATIEQMTASIDRVAKDSEGLSSSVEETSATIEQMLASIGQVGENASRLSGTVSETSATIEEMAASIRRVAMNVSEADGISQKASEAAKAGSEAVEHTIEGINRIAETMNATSKVMGSLGRRSEEIGKIVGVIEEIADQTNLLALNAAIEAARAGDAGRGFAVVADEVRKLAERSVVATKEIGEVIKQVQEETGQAVSTAEAGAAETLEGKKLADKAGASLSRILESVGATNRLMTEINNASSEQASGAAQVLKSVENMNKAADEVTKAVKEQVSGSHQIKNAVENMNVITRQLAGAMKEQSTGGRQIRLAVEDMNRVTNEVSLATKEQASGSAQIIKAVENMNSMTQIVANATAEQKRGGELVVKAVENISDIARENLGAVKQMGSAAENLTYQAESLQKAISIFKTREININCWDVLHCATEFRLKCPAYQNPEKRCWLIDSTWCKGVQQGDARTKLANCMHCEAYKVMQGIAYQPAARG